MKRMILLLILLAAVAILAVPAQAQTTEADRYYVCQELNCKIVLLDSGIAFLKTPDGANVGAYFGADEGKTVLVKIGNSILVFKVDGDNLIITMANFDENGKPVTKKYVFVKQPDVKNLGDFLSD